MRAGSAGGSGLMHTAGALAAGGLFLRKPVL